jgi:hypothetical protein
MITISLLVTDSGVGVKRQTFDGTVAEHARADDERVPVVCQYARTKGLRRQGPSRHSIRPQRHSESAAGQLQGAPCIFDFIALFSSVIFPSVFVTVK